MNWMSLKNKFHTNIKKKTEKYKKELNNGMKNMK